MIDINRVLAQMTDYQLQPAVSADKISLLEMRLGECTLSLRDKVSEVIFHTEFDREVDYRWNRA